MKRFASLVIATLTAVSAQASADVFSQYASLGTKVEKDITAKVPLREVQSSLLELATLGYGIMELYGVKFPECREQFAAVKASDAKMQGASWEALEEEYHDGLGLPTAPGHCYLGRSMVIHPYMALAILRVGGSAAIDEIQEVVVRAPKIKAKLGL